MGLYIRLIPTISTPKQGHNEQTAALDLHYISWMLPTLSNEDVHLLVLEYLATVLILVDFNPALLAECFNVLIDYMKITDTDTVIT